jgi:hypothetical protein
MLLMIAVRWMAVFASAKRMNSRTAGAESDITQRVVPGATVYSFAQRLPLRVIRMQQTKQIIQFIKRH